jgi:hypothetical protein
MFCENKHYYSGSYCHVCHDKPEKKKPKGIRRVSLKRVEENKEYSNVRISYLNAYPVCEVHNCNNKSDQIHHKAGRIGGLLLDINHFLAVCDTCHKYIELNPLWAKEHGYSESRI